ncbi:MAG: hypothetical protein V3T05_06995 [Myxococcota bacterium]
MNPEDPVTRLEPRPFGVALEDCELLTKTGVFECEGGLGHHQRSDEGE